jgi:hypothetical protein
VSDHPDKDLVVRVLSAEREEREREQLARILHSVPLPVIPVAVAAFHVALGAGVALVIGKRMGAVAADGQFIPVPVPVVAVEVQLPVLESLHGVLGQAIEQLRKQQPPAGPRLVTPEHIQ